MGENLYCPGQKGSSKKYRDNYDRIFGKREHDCPPVEGCKCITCNALRNAKLVNALYEEDRENKQDYVERKKRLAAKIRGNGGEKKVHVWDYPGE